MVRRAGLARLRMHLWARLGARCLWILVCLVVLAFVSSATVAGDDPRARVVELTNAERRRAGLAPLVWNPQLSQAAQSYAEVLATENCWAHTCGAVPSFSQRAVNAGYSDWTYLGENLAGGHRTPEAAVQGWMESAGHRANVLNPGFTEIGVGLASGGRFGIYWTQEFGTRRGQPAVAQAAPAGAGEEQPRANPRVTTAELRTRVTAPAAAQREPAPVQRVADAPAAPNWPESRCDFVLGFAALRTMLGAVAGDCLENERLSETSGNVEQRTTNGLFVWRQADNWTAFTDGHRTWLPGPYGLQQRLNRQRFTWERDPLPPVD